MSATRRAFVRRAGIAVVAATTPVAGAAEDASAETRLDRQDESCRPTDWVYPPPEGFVFYPESYRQCRPFQIMMVSRPFRTSVGRGPRACRRERREYVLYGIGYENADDAEVVSIEGVSTFLAVPTSDDGDPPLPHEYFVPGTRFQFVSSDGEFVLHSACDEEPTPVSHGVFSHIV